jgi:hypothetical protein
MYDGVLASGSNSVVAGAYVGVARDGKTRRMNGQNGLHFAKTALYGRVGLNGPSGLTIVSGNGASGVNCSAPGISIFSALVGVDITGVKAVPNNGAGVYLDQTAVNGYVGMAYNSTVAPPSTVISGNLQQGVISNGAATQISNCMIGMGRDGSTIVPNGGNGVHFGFLAKGSMVGDSSAGLRGDPDFVPGTVRVFRLKSTLEDSHWFPLLLD